MALSPANGKLFVKNYQKPIEELLSNNFWENIAKGFGVFSPILEKTFAFKNPFDSDSLREKIKNIEELISADAQEVLGIQYLYDFFKELVLAWTEFLETGRNLWYSCPTDPSLFPLHLMLGRARAQAETAAEFYQFRHGFVQPPIYNDQREEKERLAQQYRRLILMIETLELSIIQEGGKEYPVKITPSKEKYGVLGERSIPYYYNIKKQRQHGFLVFLRKILARSTAEKTPGLHSGKAYFPMTISLILLRKKMDFLKALSTMIWTAFHFSE